MQAFIAAVNSRRQTLARPRCESASDPVRCQMFTPSSRRWVVASLCLATACVRAPQPPRPESARFYAGRDYGSESQFNPLSLIFNEGFDVLRGVNADRRIAKRVTGIGVHNVVQSVLHADRTYRLYGYGRAVRNEWFPLSAVNKNGGGAWLPNYELHLMGSGMASVRMEEWYAQHGVSHPTAAAVTTMMTAHFLNEVVENAESRTPNEDAVTDLLIFDPLGILLWRSDAVQRFFSGPLEMLDWGGQPTYEYNTATVQDASQEFLVRWRLPGTERWRIGYMVGMSVMPFVAFGRPQTGVWTLGGGARVLSNPVVDSVTGAKTAKVGAKLSAFYDREGSLLFSAEFDPRGDRDKWTVNAYPGVLRIGAIRPGLWIQSVRHSGVRFGLVSGWGIGIGRAPVR